MPQTERVMFDFNTAAESALPLDQVSIEYGPEGLQFRLERALAGIALTENERRFLEESTQLALDLHGNDKRTYEPYCNHLLRVALRLIEDFKIEDAATISAALLHDSIEDHPDVLARRVLVEGNALPENAHVQRQLAVIALRELGDAYGVASMSGYVLEVSNPILNEGDDKHARYKEHVAELMRTGSPQAILIKAADFDDNTNPVPAEDRRKRERLDKKQEPVYPHVEEGLARLTVIVSDHARDALIGNLRHRRRLAQQRLRGDPDQQAA